MKFFEVNILSLIKSDMSGSSELNKYQKYTDREHILKKPDTYIGSIELVDTIGHVFVDDKIVQKEFDYIPGLYKLFDEGLVNCRDHVIRQSQAMQDCKANAIPVSNIDIGISDDGTITMINDGNGIDVAQHPEHKLWIPEMIFGHLRTSTNYDEKKKEKIVGGKNGFGFKLVLIWSTWGMIETVDHVRGLKYRQEFKDNLNVRVPPVITKCHSKPYTKVVFKPDYKRFGVENLTPEMHALFKKRIYDISAVTDRKIKVKYNSILVPVKHFQQYIDLYIGDKNDVKRVYECESQNNRWEYAVCLSPTDEFQQVSFVNGINTSKGGKHIDYIMGQIIRKLTAYIKKKKKVDVKSTSIKEQLMLFVRCDIDNPSFSSQTKDELGTPIGKFGSTCTVSDNFIEKVAKMGVMSAACALTEVKENKAAKKTDGAKTKNIRGIPKLVDANYAGTPNSSQCTIIFCEGDSAKAGIVSGLNKDDRNVIGVYPMRGKLLNTRGEALKKIAENKEIVEIKQILGLATGKEYKTIEDVHKNLRYGKVLFMTDQDLDGSHIKGLGINLFQSEWNSLSKIRGFIGFMNTPILKAKKGSQSLVFYNDGEYEKWKQENDSKGWKVKYYKGLGTSTSKEFKEYFREKKIVEFEHTSEQSDDKIDMVFNKKRADDRKDWLSEYSRESYLDTNKESVTYEEFINGELIHFSKYDCDRSIPNLMDGLKISLRKILFAAFKKNLNNEIKVAQFSGYVSEHSGYHHGEASLNGAIVGLAQNFVGSNNINLFNPNGQFGTRLQGGKDSASERYIFTQLNSLTRLIYRKEDDAIVKYLDDDGLSVEPIYYAPIIPMILVNGSKGIGTGFSTDIMCYNPIQIINCLKTLLNNSKTNSQKALPDIEPYYEGFKGTIDKIGSNKYLIKGCYEKEKDNKICITELPIGNWTDDFKQHLEKLMEPASTGKKKKKSVIRDYNDMSTDTSVHITISFAPGQISQLEAKHIADTDSKCNELEKLLKLYTTQSTTNMHMFDSSEKLKKYKNTSDIVKDFFETRLKMYEIRKKYQLETLQRDLLVLSNKAKYILGNLDGSIDLRGKKKDVITNMLKDMDFDTLPDDNEYKYLVKMPMDSVSKENSDKLINEKTVKEKDVEILKTTSIYDIWLGELAELKDAYCKYIIQRSKQSSTKKRKSKKLKLK